MNPSERIENAEIKGLSLRSLFWMLSCTFTIVFSIFTVYFNLKQQIQALTIQRDNEIQYTNLKLKDQDNKIDVNGIFIRELQTRMTQLETKFLEIK